MKFFGLLLIIIMLACSGLTAQELTEAEKADYRNNPRWREMMKQPDVNLYEAKTAFKLYMEGRDKSEVNGWNKFERWAFRAQYFVDKNGDFYNADRTIKAYRSYKSKNKGVAPLGDWSLIGPQNLPSGGSHVTGLGRLNAVEFHPYDAETLYAGAASGGLWISTDDGDTWTTPTDNLPSLGVSAIAVSHENPNHIYIGTGDRDSDDAEGVGVYKSIDGGHTWFPVNEGIDDVVVNDLLLNAQNASTLIAGTSGGIYITHDAGASWEFCESGDYWDMEYKPGDTTTVYGTNQTGGGISRSLDGGHTWESVDLPASSSRTTIAVTPANPNIVYATLSSGSVFSAFLKSTNSGATFTVQSTSPNILGYDYAGNDNRGQAWYDLCMAADPNNQDVVYVGGINVWRSEDGGQNWNNVGFWQSTIHADQHDMAFSPHDGKIYVANDGGFYEKETGKANWIDHSSDMAISQIYKMGQSAQSPNLVMTGHQDVGTNTFTSSGWLQSIGGDGMECLVDYTNTDIRYGELYYGDIRKSSYGNASFASIAPPDTYNSNTGDYTGLWVTPYCLNEFDPQYMYAGYNDLWRADDVQDGTSGYYINWENITESIYVPGKIKIVEASPADENTFFFATEGKDIFVSTDVNSDEPAWTELNGFVGAEIVDLEAHPRDKNTLYAVFNNTVYKTTDLGDTWIDMTDNLPEVSYTSIVFDKNTEEGIYIGSDMGIFYRDQHTDGWKFFAKNFPLSAFVTELEIYYNETNPSESRLRCATYGRGLWESPLYSNGFDYDLRVAEISMPADPSVDATYSPEVTIRNMGSESITGFDLVFKLNDNAEETESWSGTLNTGEEISVQFTDATLNKAGKNIVNAEVSITDGNTDEQAGNNQFSTTFNVDGGSGLPTVNFSADPTAANINETVSFAASVDGTADSYNWYFSENASPETATGEGPHDVTYSEGGAKNIMLTVTSGSDEVIESKSEFVVIYESPVIEAHPEGETICEGEDVLLSTEATGDDLEYQWKLDGSTIGGATQPYYTIYNGTPDQTGDYTCEISNPAGSIETNAATVTINPKPDLDVTVDNDVLCSGESATITVSGASSYEWSDGLGTSSEVTVSPSQSKSYFVTATDNGCATINEVHIVVPQGIEVSTPYDTLITCTGRIATLNVDAEGEMLEYQWYKNGSEIAGAVDFSYSIPDVSEADFGEYTCEVSNECFSEMSEPMYLSLKPLPVADFTFTIDSLTVELHNESENADSYYWNGGGSNTSTDTNPVFTYNMANTKLITLTAYNECGDSTITKSVPLGITDIHKNNLAIYPNPSDGAVEISLNNHINGQTRINVMSADGKSVYSKVHEINSKNLLLNLQHVNPGFYLIKIISNDQIFTGNLIIEK